MDPIAHTLFGAGMAEAGLRSKTALATATLVIGANLPDVDALAMFIDSDTALYLRRGWTHGILALLIWPFLLAGTMLLFQRLLTRFRTRRARAGGRFHPTHNGPSMRLKWLLGISFLAVWSHPLLDWMNTYGIRLLMPFSDTWFYGDTLFIVDPWLWLLSGAGVVLARSRTKLGMSGWVLLGAALTTLVITAVMVPTAAKVVWGAGILTIALVRFSGRTGRVARPIAFSLMMAALLYSAYMFAGARVTAGQARAHLAEEGVRVTEVMSNPLPARTLVRTGVAASETHYYRFRYNWMDRSSFEFIGGAIPKEEPGPVVEAALSSPDLKGFRKWMRFPVYEVRELNDGWLVLIRDLRYTSPRAESPSGIGMAVVEVGEELQVRSVR